MNTRILENHPNLEMPPRQKRDRLKRDEFSPPIPKPFLHGETLHGLNEFLRSGCPIEIEVGCGKAKFIVARAQRLPEVRFLAVDRVGKWMKIGQKRAQKRGLQNLLFVKADARGIIRDYIPGRRVSAFHIYFPDPWPKRRHRKRRIVNIPLLTLLYNRLCPAGVIHFATDDSDYAAAVKESIRETRLAWEVKESINGRLNEEDPVKTNYEAKYESAGKGLYYLEIRKV